jgi:hypothetical protein
MTFPVAAGDKPTAAAMNVPYDPWLTWIPSLTSLTTGNGTVTARYRLIGKTLDFRFKFKLGSTSAVGSDPKFTLPFAPHSSFATSEDVLARGTLLDSGTQNRDSLARFDSGSTLVLLAYSTTGGHATITATSPWTWTTGDCLSVYGTVEIA